jgi:RNA polymerase sigma-70 factor (ECF subfamily)
MDSQSDFYYIEKVLAGDTNTYAVLVNRYKDMAYTIALKVLGNIEDAEEITQDAFIKAYQSLNKFKKESKFSTWLYRIVYNAAISRTRKKSILKSDLVNSMIDNYSEDEINENVQELDETEKKKLLDKLMQSLNPDERALITLYYYEENSTETIAEIMGLTQSNVKVRLYRVRNKMNQGLQQHLNNEMKEIYR